MLELAGPGWRCLDLIWLAAPATPPAQPIQLSRTGWQLLASWYVKKTLEYLDFRDIKYQ